MTTSMITLSDLSWLSGPVQVPTRALSGDYFHQTRPKFTIDSCADPATGDARYQTFRGPGVWYGSTLERGAWAELIRHLEGPGVSPLEIKRRVGRLTVTATVLDLSDPQVQATLQITPADLTGDDYSRCQEIAQATYVAGGADGLRSPSAAMPGCSTIAIFRRNLATCLQVVTNRVQKVPVNMLDHVEVIKVIGPDADEIEAFLRALAKQERRKRLALARARQHRHRRRGKR